MNTSGSSFNGSGGSGDTNDERKRTSFAAWLTRQMGRPIEIVAWDAPEGAGHSNETILVEARTADDEPLSLVVRVEATSPAVFPRYDLGLQCACMQRIAEHSEVPVPRVRWLEEDASIFGRPFYVMDRIDGMVPTDRMPYTLSGWLFDATAEQQKSLFDASLGVMAALHAIDWRKAGLQVLDRPEHGKTGIEQQLGWWMSFAKWAGADRPQPTLDGASAWLREHVPARTGPIVINWGDARISNIMYRNFRPVAVLDWEMAMLGPVEVDVAFFLYFQKFFSQGLGVPDLPGFPSRDEAIAAYEQHAGRKLDDLRFYEAFAAWRNATVMLRIADLYEARGIIPPGTGAGQNNIASRMLAELLDLPSPGEPGGPLG